MIQSVIFDKIRANTSVEVVFNLFLIICDLPGESLRHILIKNAVIASSEMLPKYLQQGRKEKEIR